MITLTREEAQQVLEVLDELFKLAIDDFGYDEIYDQIIENFRARLSAPEPEPVAWFTEDHREDKSATTYSKKMAGRWKEKGWPVTPLYTTPPQRNEPNYRDVVIKGDLWRIEFLPDHAVSVVLVRANYEAQSEPPCKTGSQCIGGKCPQCVVPEPAGWIYEDDEGRMMFSQMPHPDPLWEPVYRKIKGIE